MTRVSAFVLPRSLSYLMSLSILDLGVMLCYADLAASSTEMKLSLLNISVNVDPLGKRRK